MRDALAALLAHRLLIITGKGGTGKTSVAAALAIAAARRGTRVVAVELAREASLPALLSSAPPLEAYEDRRDPLQLSPGLHYLRIVPEVALAQYLESQLHLGRLARALARPSGFRRLLDAAPGWQALIALGKLWHLTTREEPGGWRWPLLIVDAPATGHGLSLLSVPDAVLDAVRSGPLHRHTQQVRELLHDPQRTRVLPIALAEELPVRELLELRARAAALGIATGRAIANAIEPPPALDVARTLRALAELEDRAAPSQRRQARSLRASLAGAAQRCALQRSYLDLLRAEIGEPPLELPYLVQSIDGPAGSGALADALEGALAVRGAPA